LRREDSLSSAWTIELVARTNADATVIVRIMATPRDVCSCLIAMHSSFYYQPSLNYLAALKQYTRKAFITKS
jgi:hypothetical protein